MYDPALPRGRVFLPAMLSGLLMYASYFPLSLGFLAWVALVPLLTLVRANARPRRIAFAAFVGGLFCFVPAISWIRVAHPAMYASWLVISVYCSIFLTVSVMVIRRLVRARVPLWAAVPVVLVAADYFRAHFPTGFTWLDLFGAHRAIGFGWYMLGYTQHHWIALIQISDVTGVYGVTFVVALVNAAIFSALDRDATFRRCLRTPMARPRAPLAGSLVAATLLVATLGYGLVRLHHDDFEAGPQVALIQGNLPQDLKNDRGNEMAQHFDALADRVFRTPGMPKPDLVVWPETSYTLTWIDIAPGVNLRTVPLPFQREYNMSRLIVEEDSRRWPAHILYGLNRVEWEDADHLWKYNTALLVDPKGTPTGRYDKIHLVPFGEYVPFVETFPFMKTFTPYEGDYSCKPGERWTRFAMKANGRQFTFACVICYEDSDPSMAREYVAPAAPPVDFFVNISNDGWFNGTAEHEEHLAICRFRAVETRRSVVRAVNMGISAIIDPDGRVVALPGETWAKSKKVDGIVRGTIPLDTRTTIYGEHGEWLPVGCWLFLIAMAVRGLFRRRPA